MDVCYFNVYSVYLRRTYITSYTSWEHIFFILRNTKYKSNASIRLFCAFSKYHQHITRFADNTEPSHFVFLRQCSKKKKKKIYQTANITDPGETTYFCASPGKRVWIHSINFTGLISDKLLWLFQVISAHTGCSIYYVIYNWHISLLNFSSFISTLNLLYARIENINRLNFSSKIKPLSNFLRPYYLWFKKSNFKKILVYTIVIRCASIFSEFFSHQKLLYYRVIRVHK